jgi:hypothetical protein
MKAKSLLLPPTAQLEGFSSLFFRVLTRLFHLFSHERRKASRQSELSRGRSSSPNCVRAGWMLVKGLWSGRSRRTDERGKRECAEESLSVDGKLLIFII